MKLACLDLEGVLVPEIWVNVAELTGIDELRLTTRDIPDYDELMTHRLRVLDKHDLKLSIIQSVIDDMGPLPGDARLSRRSRRGRSSPPRLSWGPRC